MFCLIRTFLGLMFMRFHTSAVVWSALVTSLKSNVVTRGRVHSTYCLWRRLGLGASRPEHHPPSTSCCYFPWLQGMEGLEYSLGETEFILTDSKKCLKISTPFPGPSMAGGWCWISCLSSSSPSGESSWSPAPGVGHLPIPLLFLYGVPMECQAPEPREDSQLIHLSQTLDAVAMEIEDTQVEKGCQDLLGKETKSPISQGLRSMLRTDLRAEKEEFGEQLALHPPPLQPYWMTPASFHLPLKGYGASH